MINDPERRAQREELIQREYNERLAVLTEQNERFKRDLNESTFANLSYLYSLDVSNYNKMTLEQQQALYKMLATNMNAEIASFEELHNLYNISREQYESMTQAELQAMSGLLDSQKVGNKAAFDLVFGLYSDNTVRFKNMANEEKDIIQNQMVPQ